MANVADAPLTATSAGFHVTTGATYTGKVASFVDANPLGSLDDFTAAIDWGDGATTPGAIHANASGGFDVDGTKAYGAPGSYPLVINIVDDGGATTSAKSVAAVTPRIALTTTTVEASLNPVAVNRADTITAHVTSPGGGVPGGLATFSVDGLARPPVTLLNGIASLNTFGLTAGRHSVVVTYGGAATPSPPVPVR